MAGWVLGLVVIGGLVLIIADLAGVSSSSSSPSTAAYAIKLTLGVLLLLLAVRQWRSRPGPGEQAPAPKWMTALDSFTPVKSLGLGAAMSGVNEAALGNDDYPIRPERQSSPLAAWKLAGQPPEP